VVGVYAIAPGLSITPELNRGEFPFLRAPLHTHCASNPNFATQESWKNDKGDYETRTEWHRIYAWRNLSKFAKTLQKGQLINLEGTLRYREVEDEIEGTTFKHRISVAFRIIWRNVSELFGVVSALRRNASQTVTAKNMAGYSQAESKIYPYSRSNSRFSRRDACPSTSVVRTQRYAK
jgi:single-stranded DNA-binding protein